jgi:Fe-S-cluster-containing dehydrogenase component
VHWIRRGAVTVSVDIEGRDAVIQYVQAGNYVGETALLEPGRSRSATVTAIHATETVLLPSSAVTRLLDRDPDLRDEFMRRESDQTISVPARASHGTRNIVAFLLDQGAYEATDLLLIDESLCIRCDNCEKACADTHGGITRLDREGGPTYTDARGVQLHIPTACQHCEHPACMNDCPPDALRRHPNGEVYIMDNCIGCGNCVINCPYDVIQLSAVEEYEPRGLLMRLLFGDKPPRARSQDGPAHEIATKCDLCRKLPKPRGAASSAACVSSCPTGAILRVDPREFVDEIYSRQD